jgi:hypothetical protein
VSVADRALRKTSVANVQTVLDRADALSERIDAAEDRVGRPKSAQKEAVDID